MTTYTAYFRTDIRFAVCDFEADTPEDALQMARALAEHDPDALDFEHYDTPMPLDEIEISGPAGDGLAVWRSDDLRLRLAARELLEALQDVEAWLQKAPIAELEAVEAAIGENAPLQKIRAALSTACGASPPEPKRADGDMNAKRAAWAGVALASFCAVTGQNAEEEAAEAMTDLICDLLHLANAKGLNPSAIASKAIGHYEHEVLYPDD